MNIRQIQPVQASTISRWLIYGLNAPSESVVRKAIEVKTATGIKSENIYIYYRSFIYKEPAALVAQLNYRVTEQNGNYLFALELASGGNTLDIFPVELCQLNKDSFLFISSKEEVGSAVNCLSSGLSVDFIVHDPSGPITSFLVPADETIVDAHQRLTRALPPYKFLMSAEQERNRAMPSGGMNETSW